MNKFAVLLIIVIITLSSVSGVLFYQLNVVENEKNELKNEIWEVNSQLEAKQNTTIQLESQVIELQNNIEQLEQSLIELENQKNELEETKSKATNLVKITEFKVTDYQPLGGFIIYSFFNLTIENFGINDVTNLSVSILGADNEPPIIIVNEEFVSEIPIEVIYVDEELKINGRIDYNFQDVIFPVTAKLMLGDIILDENTSGLSF